MAQWKEAIQFHHLSLEQGLSQSTVTCILQDRLGMMWFGTADGLNRFDGYTFSCFKHEPSDSTTLSGPYVSSLMEDNQGRIWVSTDGGGLSVLNPYTGTFQRYQHHANDPFSLPYDRVSSVCHDSGSLFWVATFGGGLAVLDEKTGKFDPLVFETNASYKRSDFIVKMIRSHDGLFYVATKSGLYVLSRDRKLVRKFHHDPADSLSLADNRLQNITEDSVGRLWICTYNSGIYLLDPGSNSMDHFVHNTKPTGSLSDNFVTCVLTDVNGVAWIGTNEQGISLYNQVTGVFERVANNADDPASLRNNQVQVIYEDRQHIIWVGTNGGGLSLYHPAFGYFSSFNSIWKKNDMDMNPSIYSITQDTDGNTWMGSNGSGLLQYNGSTGKLQVFQADKRSSKSISSNSIWSLMNVPDKHVWAGTHGEGVSILDKESGVFNTYRLDSSNASSIGSNTILCLFGENDSNTWVGTLRTGISIFNHRSKSFTHFSHDEQNNKSLSSDIVYTIFRTRKGKIYIGTQGGGLNLYRQESKDFISWKTTPGNSWSINSNDVQAIFEDRDGLLWLGTKGGGLNAFDPDSGKCIHFTEKNGLPDNVVYAIGDDSKGNLWLSTNKGLCRFRPPKPVLFDKSGSYEGALVIRNYTMLDGLGSNEFNQGAGFKDNQGNLYFGNISGVTAFHPGQITDNMYNPPVVLTSFKVFEKNMVLDTGIVLKKQIELSYFQDFFSFEFAALNYLMPSKNEYAVMMEGFDKDWIYTGTRRYVSYTNLNPGTYTFKVKATNNDGLWSNKIASVQVLITPPFWKTPWFRILIGTLFVAAVYFIYWIRVRQIRKVEEQKTAFNLELAQVEMKALRAQMNPHFIFNSLNSINKYIWANDQRAASEYLTRFSKLIRLILENSRHQAISLDKDLEALELYMQMERLRFEQQFVFSIELGDDLETEGIRIPPLLLQPFVENSIWHGLMPKETSGKITVRIEVKGDNLYCMIEDNGVGRQRAMEIKAKKIGNHNSLGMKVTMDRIDMLNHQKNRQSNILFTDLKDENGKAAGTRVELYIPLEYNF